MAQSTRKTRTIRASIVGVGLAAAAIASSTACTPESTIEQVFGAKAPEATAIAKCESGLNPNAVSPTNDHGLFQINAVHRQQFTQVTGQPWEKVYDSYFNAVYAKHLQDRQGWQPWSCRYVLGL